MLKNCVFARISEIRELKKKPKLGDILKYFKKAGFTKERVAKQMAYLFPSPYEKKEAFEEDAKFD